MSSARLQVVGSGHTARFGEDFDQVLSDLVTACHDPGMAEGEFDELGLLIVLAHFAAAGPWDPEGRAPPSAASCGLHGLWAGSANRR